MSLVNKTLLVTGASRGIGRAIALKFAAMGYNTVINSLHGGEKLENTAHEINEIYKKNSMDAECVSLAGDVGNAEFAAKLIKTACEHFGNVDCLVNNAGISYVGLLQDMSDEDWQRIIATNLSAVHYCSKNVIPHMLEKKKGHIINISSVWGSHGASCEVAYSATKGGVNTYTKALARELAPSGISVNAIACGCIDTDMNKCFTEADLKALAEEIPVGRLGNAEEVAELVYATAQQSVYLTGQIITIDGGWM